MSHEMVLVLGLLIFLLIAFAFELMPIDKISFVILAILATTGIITPLEAISGFSNPAVITILFLMILVFGLEENGVIALMAKKLKKLVNLPFLLLLPVMMFITGFFSSFISTTAVVIVFIKLINEMSIKYGIDRGKFLIPISFAGILGGSCTMMGTSTNLIISSMAVNAGLPAIGFFEITPMGLTFLLVSIVTITLLANFVLPTDKSNLKAIKGKSSQYLTLVRVTENSPLISKTLGETFIYLKEGIRLIKIKRNKSYLSIRKNIKLKENDTLLLNMPLKELMKTVDNEGLSIIPYEEADEDDQVNSSTGSLYELIVLPGSSLIGKHLKSIKSGHLFGAVPLALKKKKNIFDIGHYLSKINKKVSFPIEVGDKILVQSDQESAIELNKMPNILLLNNINQPKTVKKHYTYVSLFSLIFTIVLAATGFFTILQSAIIGVGILLFFGKINLTDAYSSVNWQVIFLLSGLIPIGIALEKSGATSYLVDILSSSLLGLPLVFEITLVFLIAMVVSAFISNNATAVIMVPIGIALANSVNADPKPFLFAILFGANFSFFTPVGYQTNTIVYGMGIYKYKHFLILGGIISIVLLILSFVLLRFYI